MAEHEGIDPVSPLLDGTGVHAGIGERLDGGLLIAGGPGEFSGEEAVEVEIEAELERVIGGSTWEVGGGLDAAESVPVGVSFAGAFDELEEFGLDGTGGELEGP